MKELFTLEELIKVSQEVEKKRKEIIKPRKSGLDQATLDKFIQKVKEFLKREKTLNLNLNYLNDKFKKKYKQVSSFRSNILKQREDIDFEIKTSYGDLIIEKK